RAGNVEKGAPRIHTKLDRIILNGRVLGHHHPVVSKEGTVRELERVEHLHVDEQANAGVGKIAYAVVDLTSSLEEIYVGVVVYRSPLQFFEPTGQGMRHRNASRGVICGRIVEQAVF